MLQVMLEGLVGVACQITGWDVYLPVCTSDPHTAVLTARAGAVNPDRGITTWQPDYVGLDGDGHSICSWILRGMRLCLTEQGGTTRCTRGGQSLIRLDLQYANTQVQASESFLAGGTRVHLTGGVLTGVGLEPVELDDSYNDGQMVQPGPLAPMAMWTSAGTTPWNLSTDDGTKTIQFWDTDMAGPIISVTFANTVPKFSPTAAPPYAHFMGIYEALEDMAMAMQAPARYTIGPSKTPLTMKILNFSEGIPCFALAELPPAQQAQKKGKNK